MERKLFLHGLSRCGKTTIIKNALGDKLERAGGFVTERVFDGDTLRGFWLRPPSDKSGRLFIDRAAHTFDARVFSDYAPELIRPDSAEFFIIDETGGPEIMDEKYYSALRALLMSDAPVIGVIKTLRDAENTRASVNEGEGYIKRLRELCEELDAMPDCRLLRTSGRGDTEAVTLAEEWVKRYTDERG